MKLEHVGIAVTDMAEAIRSLTQVLQSEVYKTEDVVSESVVTHFISVGNTKIELLESPNDSSALSRSIRTRGPGLHHLAFEVDNISTTFKRLKDSGYRMLSDAPYAGADGKLVFFMHPSDTAKVLVEFCQTNRPAGNIMTVDGSQVTVTGNPSAPLVIVSGIAPTDPSIRPLEASHRLLFLDDSTALSTSFVNAACNGEQSFILIMDGVDFDTRFAQISGLNVQPATVVIIGTPRNVSEFGPIAERVLVVEKSARTLSNLINLDPRISIATIPSLPDQSEAEDIVSAILKAYL